jgi:hypothetical protein
MTTLHGDLGTSVSISISLNIYRIRANVGERTETLIVFSVRLLLKPYEFPDN